MKETGEFIGDCGIPIQDIDGELLLEIGYHIHKKYWRRGFAKEACPCCSGLGFHKYGYDAGKIVSQQTPKMCYNKKVC